MAKQCLNKYSLHVIILDKANRVAGENAARRSLLL